MVLRLAENGCLLKFLQKSRDNSHVNVNQPEICFTRGERIRIARDIANGMLHLSNKRVRSSRNGEIRTVRIILNSRSRCTRYIRRILCSDWPAIWAGQVGVSFPLGIARFVNVRKYLVQSCGPVQYPPNLISRLVNIAYLLYISFFKSVRSLCHSLCCCIKSLSRP